MLSDELRAVERARAAEREAAAAAAAEAAAAEAAASELWAAARRLVENATCHF